MIASIWHLAPDVWTAIATWTGVVVATAAVVTAGIAGGRQLDEARTIRRDQAQPYVVVFADESGNHPSNIDLVVKNFGKTAATDVRVQFSPPPDSAALRPEYSPITVPEVIPVLVPGQEWRTFWDSTRQRALARENDPLPEEYTATVAFSDAEGRPMGREYTFVIDWRVLIERGYTDVGNLHNVAEALDKISKVLSGVKAHHGLDVVVRDGQAIDERARKFYAARRRKERIKSGTATRQEILSDRVMRALRR